MDGDIPYTPFDLESGSECIVRVQVETAFTYLRYAGIVHEHTNPNGLVVDYEIWQGGCLAIHRGVFERHLVERRRIQTCREKKEMLFRRK